MDTNTDTRRAAPAQIAAVVAPAGHEVYDQWRRSIDDRYRGVLANDPARP